MHMEIKFLHACDAPTSSDLTRGQRHPDERQYEAYNDCCAHTGLQHAMSAAGMYRELEPILWRTKGKCHCTTLRLGTQAERPA